MTDILNRHTAKGISCYFFVIYVIFYLTGSNSALHNYIQIGLFALWNLIAIIEDSNSYSKALTNKATRYLGMFLLYYFFTSMLIGTLFYTMTYIGVYLMLYTCHMQYIYYKSRRRTKEVRFIIISSLFAWFVISISAITFYTANPSAARLLAADFTAFENLYIGGGYAIAFGSALLVVYLVSVLFEKSLKSGWKYLTILFVCVLFLLIFKTESTTTLISSVVGSIFSIYISIRHKKSRRAKFLLYLTIIAVFIFFVTGGFEQIASYMIDSTDNSSDDLYARRFNRIGMKLLSFGSDSPIHEENYVDDRWGLVVESFNTFLEHPIFGVGYKIGNVFSKLQESGVGTHSEICDMLAQFGLVGSWFFFKYVKEGLKVTSHHVTNKAYYITLTIMAIMNPFHYFHGLFVLFFLIPMINIYLISNTRHEQK